MSETNTAAREEQQPVETTPETDRPTVERDAFLCPNGCGPMLRRRCKLSCNRCGYYDSCSDFC